MDFDPIAYINTPNWQESRLGLDRIRELLQRLGNPQDDLRCVHVAGTNGKGSACAFIEAIARASGYKTGLFTSPYIEVFNERIRVDGENISDDDLREATLAVREAAEAMSDHPTEFELMTAVAFLHFQHAGCELCIVEVGLGGRLDSTNVLAHPEVCVIASIALDHTALLGTTLAAIAGEKAGIIKDGVPVVSYPQEPEAREVIERVAQQHAAPLTFVDLGKLAGTSEDFSYDGLSGLRLGVLGSYQPRNAALAIEAVRALRGAGWDIDDAAIAQGLAAAAWPGRFEIVREQPTFIVDGGHNPQGAHALVESLQQRFPGRKATFVIGILEDKDVPLILEEVMGNITASAFIVIEPDNPRAMSGYKLARAIRWTGQDILGCSACTRPYIAKSIQDGVDKALEVTPADGLIVAFGSLYSVGAVKRAVAQTGA